MALSPTRVSPPPCWPWPSANSVPSTEVLPGGTATQGLGVGGGDRVVRPGPPFRTATHALLAHLRTAGFDGAPLVLESGTSTETLTYIAGEAAVLPLRPEMLTDSSMVSVADLLRPYHAAVAAFDPAGYQAPPPRPAPSPARPPPPHPPPPP